MRRAIVVVALAAAVAVVVPKATADVPPADHVQVLALNDLHGALEPTPAAPGLAAVATTLRELRRDRRRTVTVGAGDLIGGSPLTSALFHDEPTLEALDAMDLRYSALGNHELDEGAGEIRRLAKLSAFRWLAANVLRARDTLFPPYAIEALDGKRIGFVGLTLEDTPSVVAPGGTTGLRFTDEAATANRYARELDARGVDAVFVLLHEGGGQGGSDPDPNGCEDFSGAVEGVVRRLSKRVDAVASAHTHNAYVCEIGGTVVASGAANGRFVTDWDLAFDRRSGRLREVEAVNAEVDPDAEPDPEVAAIVARARTAAAPVADRVVGRLDDDVAKRDTGALVAEAELAATRHLGAQVALMNPGGVRTGLPAGDVTYGDVFGALPFGYDVVVRTYTGADLEAALEGEIELAHSGDVQTDPLRIDGRAVGRDEPVRVALNAFLAAGNDGFPMLGGGTDEVTGPRDVDAVIAHVADRR